MNRLALLAALSLLFLGPGCGLFCIAEGTAIATPTGPRPIERLRVGDAIYSVDPNDGALVEARITAIRRSVRECMSLESGGTPLRCTPDHPIYDPSTRSYRVASEWITGDATTVSRVVDGQLIDQAVTGVSVYVGLLEVFDLTVDGPHSNFIADGVVVHNKSPADESTDDWLSETDEIPCDDSVASGHVCLTIASREFQLEVTGAAIDGTILTLHLEANGVDAPLPRLSVTYAADATESVSCDDLDTSIMLEFNYVTLSSHLDGETEDCSLSIGEQPASPGGTLSGSMTAVLQEEFWGSYLVEAEWVDIPVAE